VGEGSKCLGILKNEPVPLVIILTNYSYPKYWKKCMDLGADFFFDKSAEFEKVTEVCEQLIQYS
jgi:DNA-binding NarL/FixJ family response regulator